MMVFVMLCMLAAGLGVALAVGGALVWFYNRTVYRLHESVFKKLVALGLLPLACTMGLVAAGRLAFMEVGETEWLAWSCVAIVGLLAAGHAWVVERRRQTLLPLPRIEQLSTGPGVAINRLKPWARVVMRFLAPVNVADKLTVRHETVDLPGLPEEFEGYRIVHVTDTHVHRTLYRRWYREAIAHAGSLGADVMLFGGDFVSKVPWITRMPDSLRGLDAPDGVWYVRGNHDFWTQPQRLCRLAARLGWRLLSNEGTVLRRGSSTIALVGIESPYVAMTSRDRAKIARLPRIRIGLVHTPDALRDAMACGCCVAVAGHTHGGQIKLPVVETTVSGSPAGRWLSGCRAQLGSMRCIVSNGIGAFFPLRFRCAPEIVVVELRRSGPSEPVH